MDKVIERKEKKEEIEKCVVCHHNTAYLKSTPVEKRECYVRGVGQACIGCWSGDDYN